MFGMSGGDKIVVGFDLGNEVSQISYYIRENEDVETLSMVAGEEVYNIPTLLCKREGVNQWFFGREAKKYAEENEGILIDNLLTLALDGEEVFVEGVGFDPVALLTLFFKRTLGMLSKVGNYDKISALMITCEYLDYNVIQMLTTVINNLKMKTDQVFFQSHTESFYHYMLHQPKELWLAKTLLFEYRKEGMRIYQMECNKRTSPIVAYIDNRDMEFTSYEPVPEEEKLRADKFRRLDDEFLDLAKRVCHNNVITTVYLIGEYFTDEWMKQSLRFLCKGQRVFQGNNLYSKGACYGMLERLQASEEGKTHVFLGNDKLTSNIGMKLLCRGEEAYYALLDAGVNWFEAECELEFYLQEEKVIEITTTSLIGGGTKTIKITLEELKTDVSRLKMHLYLCRENCLAIEIEDLGFGDFCEATHHVWKQEVEL